MKTIEEVLTENPSAYLWTDKMTLDFTIKIAEKTFSEELNSMQCLICEEAFLKSNKERLLDISEMVCGANLVCTCGQRWYVHKPIVVPKNLDE